MISTARTRNLTGKDLNLSETRADFNPSDGAPVVLMQFTGKGNKEFYKVTRNEACGGRSARSRSTLRSSSTTRSGSFPRSITPTRR